LHEDVELFVTEQKVTGFQDTTISRDQTIDGDHGRIETRTTTAIHVVGWLQERHAWPSLKNVIMVESVREPKRSSPADGTIEKETRLYITSLALSASFGSTAKLRLGIRPGSSDVRRGGASALQWFLGIKMSSPARPTMVKKP
jgi:hypothetical protein